MDGDSLLARLKADHAALSEKRTVDLPLPGFPLLVGRFKAVGRETISELRDRAERAQDNVQAGLNFDADLVLNTCEGIYENNGNGLRPLNELLEEWGDDPVLFDERLAQAVGAELPEGERTARSILFSVFNVNAPDTGNDLRFSQFATRLWRWIRDGQEAVDADF